MSRLKLFSIALFLGQALAACAQSTTASDVDSLIQEGDTLYNSGQHAEALAKFRQVLKDSPGHRRATNMTGVCQALLGKPAEARLIFKGMLSKDPSDPWALSNLAWLDLIAKNWKSSITWGKKAIKADPKNGQSHYNLAVAYAGTKDAANVVAHLKKAAAIDPGFLQLVVENPADFAPVAKAKAFRAYLVASIQGKPQDQAYEIHACGNCYGSGKVNCTSCFGAGQERCSTCGGSGRQYNGQSCYGCYGSGRKNCWSCNGSRKKNCGYCYGMGAITVPKGR